MRGLAVMAVVLVHIQLYFTNKLQMPDFLPQFNIGAASVDVFFVISGFIMVYASERLFGQPGAMRTYFLRRIARIVPMYWAASSIMLVYVLLRYGSVHNAFGVDAAEYLLASYLFIPYGRPDDPWTAPILGVGWTLNYEMFFYTLFGLLIVFSRRTVVLVLSGLFCILIAIELSAARLPSVLDYWFNVIIIEFAFGMAIALAYRQGVRLPQWLVFTLVAVALAVLCWSWSKAHFFVPASRERLLWWGLPALALIGGLALAERPFPRNAFWRTAGFLGDASYSIYLIHALLLGVPAMILGRWIAPASAPWLYLVLILGATTIPALLIYVYVEKPLTEYLQRKIERRPAHANAPAPVAIAGSPPP